MSTELQKVNFQFKNGIQIGCFKPEGFSSIYEVAEAFHTADEKFDSVRLEHIQCLTNKIKNLNKGQN